MAKYSSVNSVWPEGTNEGRDLKPTAQEAISATRRLYRKFMGKPWHGTFKATSGRRYSYPKRGVYYVNPDWNGTGGWHEVVHFASHTVSSRLYNEGHGPRHAFLEKEMISHVVSSGWLDGKLRREKKPVDLRQKKIDSIAARLKRWQQRQRRAETAIRKLVAQQKRMARAA